MNFVVDTNVTIAANGRDTHADLQCQFKCVEFIESLAEPANAHAIVVDDADLILDEYKKYLNFKGQPGVGDMFFKFIHDHIYSHPAVKIKTISITPISDESRGFEELPANTLDKSDRKFLAAAVKAGADIANATDTDWHEQHLFIESLGVNVQQICPQHGCKVATRR